MLKRWATVALMCGSAWAFAAVGCGTESASVAPSTSSPHDRAARHRDSPEALPIVAVPGEPISGSEAQKVADRASFDLIVPNSRYADANSETEIVRLGEAVEMRFPPPNDHSEDLRQPYVSVYEAPWREGDVGAFYEEDLKADPDEGKSICQVGKLPAMCVEARSPSDAEKANPAFLRFVLRDTLIEVSGGDDLEALMQVAEGIASQA